MFVTTFLKYPFMKSHVQMQREATDDVFCLVRILFCVDQTSVFC